MTEMCVCGCSRETHRHYRPGTDCGSCGQERCPEFQIVSGLSWQLLAVLAVLAVIWLLVTWSLAAR
jgi:hypothetical protein